MPPTPPPTKYPVPFFLHCRLAVPATLQTVLESPTLPKLRKARLTLYNKSAIHDSAVRYDGYLNAWGPDDEVKGVVYMLANPDEEEEIRNFVRPKCVIKHEEIEVKPKHLFGSKEVVWGKVFVCAPDNMANRTGIDICCLEIHG
ncbi:hypothetical protein CC86DRAFT_380383 [Ophiobolus disseminans]|uniref:Gamma-glutamylcyclotransferase AIG2-like domain-containing protein n=1 Tax=Ophiobolus disseminans TaxID=1469910 RepID=A0A6A7A6S5_9PLEO|nr:hypothetical protein CC86DRAFT_380383 [Ophiobolus disseminans]